MHRRLRLRRRRYRDERGAVAMIVALLMTMLLVITAMVLDFGLVRIDRQVDRSAADAATLAGLHGLNLGDGTPHSYAGVCTAVRYLRANSARFSAADENSGWTNGLGAATVNGCTDVALRRKQCRSADLTTWAKWSWSGTHQGVTVDVSIESGYDLAANDGWSEDTLPATTGDNGSSAYGGCDNLAVTVSQSREPGLGSLATSSDLNTAIRSVGRIRAVPGNSAPAMLLLRRTGCPVLRTGSSGGGSFIRVQGAVASDGSGRTQAGTIHSDSDLVGCTGAAFEGLAANGIVAYAAPLASNPTAADATKPGSITLRAIADGFSGSVSRIRDSLSNVYGSSAISGTGGTKAEVTGRSLVTRSLVDDRYFGTTSPVTGVRGAVSQASAVFASGASGIPAGWTNLEAADPCKPTAAEVAALALTATSKLYVNCTDKYVGAAAAPALNAGTVYFRGWVNPGGALGLPNAHHVYIGNHTDKSAALDLGGAGPSFQVNTTGNLTATGTCSTGQSASKSVLFVRAGTVKMTSGLLRMCRTTTFMMGGRPDGCVPATSGIAPTTVPCPGTTSSLGSGQIGQNGGDIDWTAPDTLDATTDPITGLSTAAAEAAWRNVNGPEDLALWSESATNSSTTFNMAGGGLFNVRGVFMVPNATPFIISGGASLNLTNAQFIASNIELNGSGTNITMSVDPNSVVNLPDQGLVGLVR